MSIKLRALVRNVFLLVVSLSITWVTKSEAQVKEVKQWESPFERLSGAADISLDSLTLSDILRLVAQTSPSLQAGEKRIQATEGLTAQAGLRPNPVFEIVAEEVGGDAAGFKESETSITLSQEFELWGKRGARTRVAKSEAERVRLDVRFAEYDVYATAVERFFEVAHAQRQVTLSRKASQIARTIAETARIRVERGASLQSEYLLGELEFERAQLNLSQAESELMTAKERLSSLWKGPISDFSVKQPENNFETLANLERLEALIANGRDVSALNRDEQTFRARLKLERSNSKPSLTLSGGFKRLEAVNSNTFIIGAGLPLPFFNRNQGSTASLKASIEALKLQREQAQINTEAEFGSARRALEQLVSRFRTLNGSILPKAEETYSSLKDAYERGRIPYSILLEAQRTLIDLRFELNDINLAIRQELVALERLLGVTLN